MSYAHAAYMREYRKRRRTDPAFVQMHREASKKWKKANPEKAKASNFRRWIKKAYGLTKAAWDALVIAQNGACAICREIPSGKGLCGKLHVDHDHATGRIRALLCANCNRMLGMAKDRPSTLRLAAEYLEKHSVSGQ